MFAAGTLGGTAVAAGGGALAGYAAGHLGGYIAENWGTGYEDAAEKLRTEGYDVYKPKAQANRALEQTMQLENTIDEGRTSLDTYEDQRWTDLGNLMVERAGSFMMTSGIMNFMDIGFTSAPEIASTGENITQAINVPGMPLNSYLENPLYG